MKKFTMLTDQTMKRFQNSDSSARAPRRFTYAGTRLLLNFSLILTMLLTLGVGQMWADWYVKGDWNSWGENDKLTISGTTASKKVNITSTGVKGFKLFDSTGGTDNDKWYGNSGRIGCNVSDWEFAKGGSNCYIWICETGNYTFSFNTSTKKLSVTYPSAQVKVYYLDNSSWSSVTAHRWVTATTSIDTNWDDEWYLGDKETIGGVEYYYTYAKPGTSIIFRKGGDKNTKTGDMAVEADTEYKYVAGTGNSWNYITPVVSVSSAKWAYLSGQTITLTATAEGGNHTYSYQWQKKGASWTNISGATSSTYTVSSCTSSNAGKYRCKVTSNNTSAYSCADGEDGLKIKVYTLNGGYTNDDWSAHDITWTSGTQGTARVTLTAGSTYKFKVYDGVEAWFGSDVMKLVGGGTNQGMWSDNGTNAKFYTGPEGEYTFTIDISGVASGSVTVKSVSYPEVTHPAAGYVYCKKGTWSGVRLHLWKNGSSEYDTFGNGPVLPEVTICGTIYGYTSLAISDYDRIIFMNSNNSSNQTGNISYTNLASYSTKYSSGSGTTLTAWPTATISFAGNGKNSGSMSGQTPLKGNNVTLTSNAFGKTGYTFSHWTADTDVKINGSTVSAGSAIADGATLQTVCGDVELTAQWIQTILLDQNNATTAGSTELSATYNTTLSTAGITNPERIGYSFAGWETEDGGVVINADKTVNTVTDWTDSDKKWIHDGSSTLYAKWTPVALTFKADATSSVWGTASNWNPACVPTLGHDVTIRKAVTVSSNDAVAKSIAFEADGSLTIASTGALEVAGTITNDAPEKIVVNPSGALIFDNSDEENPTYATVGLSMSSDEFHMIAIPVGYVSVSSTFSGSGVFTYVWEQGKGWDRRGYYYDLFAFDPILIKSSIGYYSFSGALVSTDDQGFGVGYYTEVNGGDVNMFGNSWTAPIGFSGLTFSGNVEHAVHVYDDGTGWWKGYISGDVIPALQAFAVLATGTGGGSVSIPYSAVRGVSNGSRNASLKAPARTTTTISDHITLYVSGNELQTNIRLFENEQFSDAIDNGWEAVYMEGEGRAGELYAQAQDKMNVLATSNLEGTVIGFVPGEATSYTISFEGDGRGYYLNDIVMEQSTLIEEGNTYEFTPDESTNATRFVISRTPIHKVPTSVDAVSEGSKARKQMIDGTLYIIRDGKIFDATGASVK